MYTYCVLYCFFNIWVYSISCLAVVDHDVQVMTKTTQSWMSARENCMLAGINMTGEVDVGSTRFNIVNANFTNREAWIGAYVTYTPWIEFDRCIKGYSIRSDVGFNVSLSKEPVKDCYNKCQSNFSLSGDLCFCTTNYNDLSGCLAKPCTGNNLDICGDKKTLKHTGKDKCTCRFHLRKFDSFNGTGNCVITKDRELKSENCSNPHSYRCKGDNSTSYDRSERPLPWSEAVLQCYKDSKQFEYLTSIQETWSRIFRKFTYTWGHPVDDNYHCLSASLGQEGQISLNVQHCDEQLPMLCYLSQQRIRPNNEDSSMVPSYDTSSGNGKFEYYIVAILVPVILILLVLLIIGFFLRQKYTRKTNKSSANGTTDEAYPVRSRSFNEQHQPQDLINDPAVNGNEIDGTYNELHDHKVNKKTTYSVYNNEDNSAQKQDGENDTYGYDHFQRQKPDHSPLFDYDTMANIRANEENAYGAQPEIQDVSTYDTTASIQQDIQSSPAVV